MSSWALVFVTALGMATLGYRASLVGSKRARAMIPLVVALRLDAALEHRSDR
jgi:hypothetical protein